MSAAFTPGPWTVDNARGRGNNWLRVVTGHIGIARVNSNLHDVANARLIAAAPSLYDALATIAAKLDGAEASFGVAEHALGGPLTDEDAVTVTIGELRAARAALALARGEQPA